MLFNLGNEYINLNNITRIESLQHTPIRADELPIEITIEEMKWLKSLYKIYFTDNSEIVVEKEIIEEIIKEMRKYNG